MDARTRRAVRSLAPRAAPVLAAVLLAAPATAQEAPRREVLYVENSRGGDVTVIAVPEHRVLGSIPASVVGNSPDDVVVSPDGRTLYVNRLATRDVLAIDTGTEREAWRVAVGGEPHHMSVTPDGRFLFVPLFSEGVVEVVDTEQRAVVGRVPVGPGPHATRLSPDGARLYVGGLLSDQVTVVDVATRRPLRRLLFPHGVRPFEISPDERYLYAQLSKTHGFVVYDLEAGRLAATVHLPPLKARAPEAWPYTVNHGMALTRDGRTLMVAATVDDYVAFYALPSLELLGTVPTGRTPGWLTLSQDGRFVYASNRGDGENTVSVISVAERREVARIPVGDVPQRMTTARVPRAATPPR